MGRSLLNRLVNPVVRAILSSPLHRILSGRLLLITYVGVRNGETHTIPVAYRAGSGDALEVRVGAPDRKVWWRSLRDRTSVELRLRGDIVGATAHAVERSGLVRVRIEPMS